MDTFPLVVFLNKNNNCFYTVKKESPINQIYFTNLPTKCAFLLMSIQFWISFYLFFHFMLKGRRRTLVTVLIITLIFKTYRIRPGGTPMLDAVCKGKPSISPSLPRSVTVTYYKAVGHIICHLNLINIYNRIFKLSFICITLEN